MSRYTLIVCCLHCELELDCVTEGTTDGYTTNAIARCEQCGREYLIAVSLSVTRVGRRETAACGTDAGYRRHLRHHEAACGPCLAAHRRAQTGSKEKVA